MADSPLHNATGLLRLSIHCAGTMHDGPVLSATIRHAFNRIPWARLELLDGDMPKASFPLSDSDLFKPGVEITVKAGYDNADEAIIFTGIVVRHGIRINGDSSRLVVECRASACRMATSKRTAPYADRTDGEIIQALIGNAGLSAEVVATSIRHSALVQYDCSDWDFMLARAEAMGLLVTADGSTVTVQAPPIDADTALTLTWGVDLIDFDADIDALTQWSAVQASSWSPADQSLLKGASAASTMLTAQGNLQGAALAAVASPDVLKLQTCAPQPREVLDARARAVQVKAALARVRGRMSFQGSALARPGAQVELAGVGQRFKGPVLLSAVEHQFQDGNWISQAEFGMDPQGWLEQPAVMAAPKGGLLPGVAGLQIGVVLQLEGDPAGEHRVRVHLPACQSTTDSAADGATDGIWARLLHPQASNGFGSFLLPEVGDEVLLGHLDQDPSHPVVLGSLYSSRRPPPCAMTATNDIKTIVTRSRHRIEFNDADKRITITTPADNQLVFSDKDKLVLVKDQSGNSIRLSDAGITLDSPKNLSLTAKGNITLDAAGAISIRSTADLKLDGLNVACQAQIGASVKGAATAELSAAGQTTVKGAMVFIN